MSTISVFNLQHLRLNINKTMARKNNVTVENFQTLFEKALSDNFTSVFLNALNNDNIKDQLMSTFSGVIDLIVEEKVEKIKDDYNNKLKVMRKEQNDKICSLNKEITNLKLEQEELQQYSYREDLIVKGLDLGYAAAANPNSDSNCKGKVMDLFNKKMGLNIPENAISTAHQLPTRNVSTTHNRKPPPSKVIVRFCNRDIRNQVYDCRLRLKGAKTPTYIDEHLIPERQKTFGLALRLKREGKIWRTWTKGCKLFASLGQDKRPFCFRTENELLSQIPGNSNE